MTRRPYIVMLISLLIALFIISIIANIALYKLGREYHLKLNSTRLDPFGMTTYPVKPSSRDAAHRDNPLVVIVGDSRATSWTAPPQATNYRFINRGINGQTSAQVVGRYASHVISLKPDVVVLQVGINDVTAISLFPSQGDTIVLNCKRNIQQIVDLSIHQRIRVILTTIFPLGRIPLTRRLFWSDNVLPAIEDVNRFLSSLESEEVVIFDTKKVLATSEGMADPLYIADFMHLNEKGYAALNRELVRLLPLKSK